MSALRDLVGAWLLALGSWVATPAGRWAFLDALDEVRP